MATSNLASLVHNPARQTPTPAQISAPAYRSQNPALILQQCRSPCKAHMSYLGLRAPTCAQTSLYFATQGARACTTLRSRPRKEASDRTAAAGEFSHTSK